MKYFLFTLIVCTGLLGLFETASAQDLAGAAQCTGTDCSACNLVYLANAVIKWLIGFLFVVFAVLMAVAGWGLVVSGGNRAALDAAKEKFTNAIIGFIIILSAWLVIDTIIRGLVDSDGMIDGGVSGRFFWAEVECQSQIAVGEAAAEDAINLGGVELVEGGFDQNGNVSAGGVYDASGNLAIGALTTPSGIAVNESMRPIFDSSQGGSSMVKSGADARMQQTLAGPFARLQQIFGKSVVINDALAKAGTSRERNTTGSRHFYGDALDLSTAGMTDDEKIRLFEAAKQAGFTGFGFGSNILHVDLGPSRGWSYSNSTYGGRNVRDLINSI